MRLKVRNEGSADFRIHPAEQLLWDREGHSFSMYDGIVRDADDYLGDTPIRPHETIHGIIFFDVPADSEPEYVELHASEKSKGVRVRLSLAFDIG